MNFESICARLRTRHFDGNFSSAPHLEREVVSGHGHRGELTIMVSGGVAWRESPIPTADILTKANRRFNFTTCAELP